MNLSNALSELLLSKDLELFYHRWSIAQVKGLPISEMFRSFGQTAPPAIKARISTILRNLEQGTEFHHNASACFTELEIALLDIGFSTGTLEEALTALTKIYSADATATKRLKRKMLYPMFVCFLGCWILPIPLILYVGVWFWILISMGLSAALFSFGGWIVLRYFQWLQTKPKAVYSRFFGGLAMALEAGCSFPNSLELAKKIAAPSELEKRLRYTLYTGQPLSEILQKTGAFSQNLIAMVQSGEVSGKLPDTLKQISKNLELGLL